MTNSQNYIKLRFEKTANLANMPFNGNLTNSSIRINPVVFNQGLNSTVNISLVKNQPLDTSQQERYKKKISTQNMAITQSNINQQFRTITHVPQTGIQVTRGSSQSGVAKQGQANKSRNGLVMVQSAGNQVQAKGKPGSSS